MTEIEFFFEKVGYKTKIKDIMWDVRISNMAFSENT